MDADDFVRLNVVKWYAFSDGHGNFYASNWKHGFMHRFIVELAKGDPIDATTGTMTPWTIAKRTSE